MALPSDLELMVRVRQGDAESFGELLRRHRGPLVGYFSRMIGDRTLAEDLAQEVFLRVYGARRRYRPDAKFTTWLYRIATNLVLNAIRDRREVEPRSGLDAEGENASAEASRFVDGRPTVEQSMMRSDRQRIIRQAIEALPGNQRAAVVLHKYQDVEYRQIARVLGVSESAVKSLLFRAYETLRGRLAPLMKEGQL